MLSATVKATANLDVQIAHSFIGLITRLAYPLAQLARKNGTDAPNLVRDVAVRLLEGV